MHLLSRQRCKADGALAAWIVWAPGNLRPAEFKIPRQGTGVHLCEAERSEGQGGHILPTYYAWKIIHALADGEAACIQSFEPVWLREKRLAFWQETASCTLTRFIITHCVVDPTTYLVGSETEGGMTSVAGICEYISRTEGPDASAAVAADVENGELDETIAAFGPRCRLFSYKAGGVWETYIRGIVPKAPLSLGASQPALQAIQFFEPADPENGPFPVKASNRGRGKRARNSAPAFVPPPPPSFAPAAQQHAGQQRIDEMLPRQVRPRTRALPLPQQPRGRRRRPQQLRQLGLALGLGLARALGLGRPSSSAGPSPVPFSLADRSPGFGAQQEAERQALAARQAREAEARRQALWAQRLQRTLAFRAELEAGFRARQISGAEASETWRAFEAETAGLAKTLAQPYRRVAVPQSYARRATLEASRAEIDAAEEQAEREEAEDNARFRHLHH
eukprot:tig00021762_g23476.t1